MFRCYKAFRKMVKIYCGLGEYEKMMDATRKMLKYIKGSYQDDSIYRFLQSLRTYGSMDLNMLQELWKITGEPLKRIRNNIWYGNYHSPTISWKIFWHIFVFSVDSVVENNLELHNILFNNHQYTPISKVYNLAWLCLKLSCILLNNIVYFIVCQILKELHKYYQNVDETNDEAKTRDLCKVYVIEFQLYTETYEKRNQEVCIY